MFFSTYFDNPDLEPLLPCPGHLVTINDPDQRQPLILQQRIKSQEGAILFQVDIGCFPAEVFEWWPDVGDIVTVNAGLYSTWQAKQQGVKRLEFLGDSHLYGECKVQQISKDWAFIRPTNARKNWTTEKIPAAFCHVLTLSGVKLRDKAKIQHILEPERAKPSPQALDISRAAQQDLFEKFGISL